MSGQCIHLFNGEPLLKHQVCRVEHDRDANAIRDEVRCVVGEDHLFAQRAIGKRGKGSHHNRIALCRGDHFHKPHIARRIEEVRPEETLLVCCQLRGYLLHRQAGGIGGQNGMGR